MIEYFNRRSLYWGIPGAILQVLGGAIHVTRHLWLPPNVDIALGVYLILLGSVLLLAGMVNYAEAKGRSPAWCLLALLGLPGWIVMIVVLASTRDLSLDGKPPTS
jgi:hypothetical protein